MNKTQALSALQQLIASFASLFVESDEPKAWAQLIMREQAKPSDAFDLLYDGHIAQVQEIFTQLIAARLGIAGDSDEAKLRGHALFGQILIFIVSRESVLRHLGVAQLEPKHVRLIHALLMAHAEGALSVALPEEVRGDA